VCLPHIYIYIYIYIRQTSNLPGEVSAIQYPLLPPISIYIYYKSACVRETSTAHTYACSKSAHTRLDTHDTSVTLSIDLLCELFLHLVIVKRSFASGRMLRVTFTAVCDALTLVFAPRRLMIQSTGDSVQVCERETERQRRCWGWPLLLDCLSIKLASSFHVSDLGKLDSALKLHLWKRY